MRRIIAVGLAAVGLLAAGCSSSPARTPSGSTQSAGASSHGQSATGSPVGPPGAQASGVLRLGLSQDLADAPALTGWQMGFFGQNLGQVTLEPESYSSSAPRRSPSRTGSSTPPTSTRWRRCRCGSPREAG